MRDHNKTKPAVVGRRASGVLSQQQGFHVQDANTERLLQRLDGVQNSGSGWRARCPACGGLSRKLSVAESGGRVLIYCFAGCSAVGVLSAVGLCWADLQPPRNQPVSPEECKKARQAIREAGWVSALSVLSTESKVVQLAAYRLSRWQPLSEEDDMRLLLAVARIDQVSAVFARDRTWRPGRK